MIKLYLMNYMIRYASNYLGICNKLPDAILALYIYIYIYTHTHTHTHTQNVCCMWSWTVLGRLK